MSLFQVNDNAQVSVHGHLDRDTLSKNFWESLTSSQSAILVKAGTCCIDLGDVERVDSAGLAWILNAIRDGKGAGISVSLREPPEKLRKLAKISDVDGFLPVE
ncbi:STAS domain-containing protein [Alteromonas sp. 1_MG-2023]|uniref:STAS domain-containing protein n=1 Tax=Alteromonas sp. 1_MG-2023 TaxID=3062669 RepID=UPI0026E21361|nr:STAS domain-containing protein [Alteromonas sp. 1_MG-2023]MDO6565617.1 STAS domain-containing protein [Alteromonas sp. 1_MG-2023]